MEARISNSRGLKMMMFWIIVSLVVMLDQATKAAVRLMVSEGDMTFIPGVLDLTLVENTGAAFSLGAGAGVGAFFVLIALAVLVVVMFILWREPNLPMSMVLTLGCVGGGGIGNMIDRVVKGSVTDFLKTTFINFPIFNVADICVTVGVVLTFILYVLWDRKQGAHT
ncbi:MAG: signal peptidase II [Atopobiaceae bacterium]|jgi:signal peptidase II